MPNGNQNFSDTVAIVNGGTRGIGREIAIQLADAGARVVITGRTKHQGEKTLAQLHSNGSGDALFVQMDATKEAEIIALHEKVAATFGGFDFAVNNLGVEDTPLGTIDESSEAVFDHCVSIKAKSAFLGMKHQVLHFKEAQKPGAIVNMSSMIGLGGHANVPAYTAANGAVQALTKSVAMEVADMGIRVNCVCPSAIDDSPMLHRFTGGRDGSDAGDEGVVEGEHYKGYLDQAHVTYPMKKLTTVGEVAGTVMFLLSPAASAITGHLLPVDGGFVVNLSR
jgi:NAD(P)-dependent dehydrogenase (short-subunit alcohol dehydrogenase family)